MRFTFTNTYKKSNRANFVIKNEKHRPRSSD
uniref:Uncharacterized protein n=1 Tax=Rhizophora mucronata TaxID=61149 RepID=A0A2P2PAD9_RHIMU